DAVGRAAGFQDPRRERRALLLQAGEPHLVGFERQAEIELLQDRDGDRADLGADAVTRKNDQLHSLFLLNSSSKPPKPASAMVGTLGNAAARFGPMTAKARSLPPSTCGAAAATLANMKESLPRSRSSSAARSSWYRTRASLVLVIRASRSPAA